MTARSTGTVNDAYGHQMVVSDIERLLLELADLRARVAQLESEEQSAEQSAAALSYTFSYTNTESGTATQPSLSVTDDGAGAVNYALTYPSTYNTAPEKMDGTTWGQGALLVRYGEDGTWAGSYVGGTGYSLYAPYAPSAYSATFPPTLIWEDPVWSTRISSERVNIVKNTNNLVYLHGDTGLLMLKEGVAIDLRHASVADVYAGGSSLYSAASLVPRRVTYRNSVNANETRVFLCTGTV